MVSLFESNGVSKSTPALASPRSYRFVILALLLRASIGSAEAPPELDRSSQPLILDQLFLTEYALGVQRVPLDGGRIYGWKISDKVTFGRFKGENDNFGFSVELDRRQRVEITTDGLRWRRAIGGGSH